LRSGATRLCVADTVGCSTPSGADAIVRFARNVAEESGVEDVTIDWHGHRDRGLEVANAMAAWRAGARRCHGTVLGVGERSGNAPIELLLVNLYLLGFEHHDLGGLADYVAFAARALGVPIPPGTPVVGADAFRTGTGTHAAAVRKAERMGDTWLAERVYSCIPPSALGRTLDIEVGPMSGEANVRHYFERRGLRWTDAIGRTLLERAKAGERVLRPSEIEELVSGADRGADRADCDSGVTPVAHGAVSEPPLPSMPLGKEKAG
jgi:2-isopropylmalate synthase